MNERRVSSVLHINHKWYTQHRHQPEGIYRKKHTFFFVIAGWQIIIYNVNRFSFFFIRFFSSYSMVSDGKRIVCHKSQFGGMFHYHVCVGYHVDYVSKKYPYVCYVCVSVCVKTNERTTHKSDYLSSNRKVRYTPLCMCRHSIFAVIHKWEDQKKNIRMSSIQPRN